MAPPLQCGTEAVVAQPVDIGLIDLIGGMLVKSVGPRPKLRRLAVLLFLASLSVGDLRGSFL
jgi:hypothetical protein